jgi:hypothetical protein
MKGVVERLQGAIAKGRKRLSGAHRAGKRQGKRNSERKAGTTARTMSQGNHGCSSSEMKVCCSEQASGSFKLKTAASIELLTQR